MSTFLCRISFTDDNNKITYRSYNFYVYPQGKDQNLRCSGSCLTFLAEQNFDFNQLFRKGISCCTQDVSQKLRTLYDERKKNREDALEVNDERSSNYNEVMVPLEELDRVNEFRYAKRSSFTLNQMLYDKLRLDVLVFTRVV